MTAPVLRVDALTTGYLHAPVLREVTIDVGDEIVAVLGANGAGKTTLLRALSGDLRAWSGSVSLGERTLGRMSTWDRARAGIAHVPEGRHVFGAMTVADNLEVAGLVARKGRFNRDDVYGFFPRLAERRQQLAGSLSGGEQQMLVIGRALMSDPKLLLVDEMSAGLAPVTARLLVETLAEIHTAGVAMLLVEQSPHLIEDAVDRVYVLERGGVTAQGTIAEIGGVSRLAEIYLAAS